MAEKIAVLATSKDRGRVEFNAATSLQILKAKIRWDAKGFDQSSLNKIEKLIDDYYNKKYKGKDKDKEQALKKPLELPVEYCVSLDDGSLKYFARFGKDRVLVYSALLSAIKPHDKRLEILDGLAAYGVVDGAFINAYKERDPMD